MGMKWSSLFILFYSSHIEWQGVAGDDNILLKEDLHNGSKHSATILLPLTELECFETI